MIDYIAIRGELRDRVIEYVDELHEHFVAPAQVRSGRYLAPDAPGYSIDIHHPSPGEFAYPGGAASA